MYLKLGVNNLDNKNKHTFVICAYKESEYLEECILSLKAQEVKSDIIMITSTPNDFIKSLSDKHKIPLYINEGPSGIVEDWNFGYSKVTTPYLTIAHQDDVYSKRYSKKVIEALEKERHPLIAFTDYGELREGQIVKKTKMLAIKRLMLSPFKLKALQKSIWVRRRVLSFGNPICCPSVTFVKDNLPTEVFSVKYRACEDWEAWEKLSKLKGSYVYVGSILTLHRIHEESETSKIIGDNVRSIEDYDMYRKFWPECIAKILIKGYSKAQDSNNLEKGK